MGARGPLTKPFSIRGEKQRRERKKQHGTPDPPTSTTPSMPEWLPADARTTWDAVLSDLVAAGVPLQRIDAHGIGMFVLTVLETKKAAEKGDTKLAARLGRDGLQWANTIGATPAARARLNITAPKPKTAPNPWDDL